MAAFAALEGLDQLAPLGHRRLTVQHKTGAPKHAGKKIGQMCRDLPKLSEDHRLPVAFRKVTADFAQPLKLSALFRFESVAHFYLVDDPRRNPKKSCSHRSGSTANRLEICDLCERHLLHVC